MSSGDLLDELGVVVAARLGAVAAAHQEEVLDLAGLDQLDDLLGVVEHRVAHEAHVHRLAGDVFGEAGHLEGLLDDRGEVAVLEVGHARPADGRPW